MKKAITRRKRIAFVSDAIYPYNKGGKETRLYQITTRLAQAGFDVHVYTMQWWEGEKVKQEDGVTLHAICPLYPLYDGHRRSITQGILFGLACFKLIAEDFDVVDVDHMPFFPLYSMRVVCWLKGKKFIGTWNEVWGPAYWKTYLPGFKGTIAWWIEKFSVSLPDLILSISPHTQKKLTEVFGVSSEKIVYIPCGYDAESIQKAPLSEQKSDVIFVGRLLEHKHVDVLIESIALLKKQRPSILCRVIGVGPEEKSLKELTTKLGLEKNVIFHGELDDHQDVYSLMKASKVFVLPSTREGFGIVVLEANACGIPVITVDHPDNAAKELIAQDNGITSDLSSESLVNLISFLFIRQKKPIPFKNDWNYVVNEYVKL